MGDQLGVRGGARLVGPYCLVWRQDAGESVDTYLHRFSEPMVWI